MEVISLVLHYKEYGDQNGPLMVFIHGGGVSGWMWNKQIDYFSNYHCIVPDLLGQGQSSSDTDFTINSSAEKIINLMEEKGKKKQVIVIGFSLGAQILIAMLSIKPNLIDYAMINSALVRPIPFMKPMTKMLMLTLPFVKNRAFSNIQAKSMYIDKDDFETYYQESLLLNRETFARILEENMSFRLPENFKNSSSKILVTVGEKEKGIMKKSFADILRSHPSCTGLIIPNIGHGVSLAKPDYFHQLIEDWLAEDVS